MSKHPKTWKRAHDGHIVLTYSAALKYYQAARQSSLLTHSEALQILRHWTDPSDYDNLVAHLQEKGGGT